jgi:hypothetical protein
VKSPQSKSFDLGRSSYKLTIDERRRLSFPGSSTRDASVDLQVMSGPKQSTKRGGGRRTKAVQKPNPSPVLLG